ncbi:MAG: 5'/3'-nucleotidase SurE, partial [Bacteroidota bacterium]|nr:5'/3'-nucleotidase SurE [Bacteroidota bacterium]
MRNNLQILVTNDDGYQAKGIQTLARIMQRFGNVTVVAPKMHQSGMSLAVSMGCKAIAAKALGKREGADWYYVDATPSSCVKFGIDNIL